MPAFVIVIINKVIDPQELAEYRRIGVPSLKETNVKFRVRMGAYEVLEGDPVEGIVMLEFPTMEEAKAWYHSPAYQEALKHRYAGAKCHAFLVEGA
ncbi:MAG TPA: DUF1330 domain-containing protein [Stellaceae bacterium]|nr:DUF1330 domain-containing protein [Stellaceae bacterium]